MRFPNILVRTALWSAALSVLASVIPANVRAQSGDGGEARTESVLRTAREVTSMLRSRAQRLGTSAGPDPDTVYVGKSFSNHVAPDNYWNLYTGSYRPGINDPDNALWDWDHTTGIQAPDSLQGWWPLHRQYNSAGGLTLPDDLRPWWALDHGNLGNYVLSQQSTAKRTFGVVGYWHGDPGNTVNPAGSVPWTPLSGTRSAWCGLRQHGDLTVVDAVTHNAFNQNVVQYLGDAASTGCIQRFPGYVDQMDQMLYRDIFITNSQSLTVSFKYRTRMSTSISTAAATRTGWFHGDPLAVTPGNFISSSATGSNAPQDSFMVYVGAPVNDAACVYSDGTARPVYDKQRRWFSEVVKTFGAGATYYELLGKAGNNPADTLDATPVATITVPAAQIANILSPATSGNVRLVFRCKTNRLFADSDARNSGYSSFGYGAVLLDDVSVDLGAGAVAIGDFELPEQGGVNAIDNRFPLPLGLAATDVWRSTGKPPGEYFHIEHLDNLTYNDLCGPPNSPARHCNIGGLVITAGNHDDGEGAGDSRFTAFREISQLVMSPTINLVGAGIGGAIPNSQGITASIAAASDDIMLWFDVYAGMFNLAFTGNSWVFGSQTYPAAQIGNNGLAWGQPNFPGFIVSTPEPQCFTDVEPFAGNGTPLRTSNFTGIPDSIRFFLAHQQQCFRFAISLGCNSSDGGYFDNASLAFVDLPGVPGQASAGNAVSIGGVSSDIWQFVNDTFPANETAGLPGTAGFDTTTAWIRTGLNISQATANTLRFDIPGDSSVVIAGNATVTGLDDPALRDVRVDLVFRILPGPGNYQIAAGRNMLPGGVPNGTLLQSPTNQTAVVVPGDASFWGQYMADAGEVSAGNHNGHTRWDPLTWNSARMDTAQLNVFPVGTGGASVPTGQGLVTSGWMTMYHESDAKFVTLGVNKFKCFVIDTTKAFTSSVSLNNASCSGVVPAWLAAVPQARTGFDGSATTKEFTKIIPDGLLTPGSHVQYFYRKSHAIDPFLRYAMCPDTNFITPQVNEGPNTDMHRWQQFSVLPDRWKNNVFGGAGMACMLYVDLADRRGNEGAFVGVLDSVCATAAAKHGAHNGWFSSGTVNLNGLDVRTNMSVAVSNLNSQPGTTWDLYGVKAAESLTASAGQLGSRLANRANMGFAAGRESRQGPTPEMLRAYYRTLAMLSGDLSSGVLGPFVNRGQNDIALFNDYLTAAAGLARPRGILVMGDGFAQSEKAAGGFDPAHTLFLTDKLGLVFRNPSYQSLSANIAECTDLLTTTALTSAGDVYGVANNCAWSNDVLQRNPAVAEASEGAFYQNVFVNGPYVANVVKPSTPLRPWIASTAGYDFAHLSSRYCEVEMVRVLYSYYVLNRVFGSICQISGPPFCLLDAPGSTAGGFRDAMKLGGSLMRGRPAQVMLTVANTGRVRVVLYDVAGRKVRVLADRVFAAGAHTLQWDGTGDTGEKVARGVYFVKSSNEPAARRVVVLSP
ncbi:MAG: FlgD immunoglobulin-like domain containing protein [Candidatus Eisenbacteria bacterium]